MEMCTYEVTFIPLAKQKNLMAESFDVEAHSAKTAERKATALLSQCGLSRSQFKKAAQIKLVRESEPEHPADCKGCPDCCPVMGDATYEIMQKSGAFDAPEPEPSALDRLNAEIESLKLGEVKIFTDLSNELYHDSVGISCSKLKLFLECPAKYRAQYISGTMPEVQKTAFDLGSAVHIATLEPHRLAETVICQPEDIKQRRGAAWEAFEAANQGKLILKPADYQLINMANKSVAEHPYASLLIKNGQAETSIYKRDEETGLIIKCRPDYRMDGLLVDVKTAASAEPRKFGFDAKKFGYHIQDAMYRDISGVPEFAFLVIENKAPCIVTAPVIMSDEAKRLGYLKYRDGLRRLKHAIETNVWEGYTSEPVYVGLTGWEEQQLEQLEQGAA